MSDVSNIVKLHKDNDTREGTRGHSLKLFIELACTNVRKESFSLRVTRLWNDLDLTRFAIQAKGPDGKWTRKPLAYRESNNVHLLITRPPEMCQPCF